MQEVCCGVAATFGGQINYKYHYGYPPTVNSYPTEVSTVKKAAQELVGEARVLPTVTMGAEDFSYFLHKVRLQC